MNTPLVSILMTSYNREKYIAIVIESVLASTFKDFELIIVDDGSKDKTVAIAREFAAKDPRIRVYQNEKNLGDYPNRNKAASYAKGKYIKYVDADDYIYPFALEQMIYYMEQPEYADVAFGIFGLIQDMHQPYPLMLQSKELIRRHYVDNIFTLGVAPLSTIIRRDIFELENGFLGGRMSGDLECWTRLALKYPAVIIPVVGCWYRRHAEQEIKDVHHYLGSYHKITKNVLAAALEKEYINESEFKSINKKTKSKFLRMMAKLRLMKNGRKEFNHNLQVGEESLLSLIKTMF